MLKTTTFCFVLISCALLTFGYEKRDIPTTSTVTELVRFWGYPIEEHFVLTEDGYILGMHRIPYGKSGKNGGKKPGPPVFLAHGLTSSSAQWVFGPPEKSLGLLLADAGYDVWMGNTRGNTYSRNHVSFDPCPSCPDFWNFGFDDTGVKDYSAEIDHILEINADYEKMHFVGHSMGCTQFVILMSEKPEYNDKIIEAYLLAPAVFMTHAPHPIFILTSFAEDIEAIFQWLGMYEFAPNSQIVSWIGHQICNEESNPDLADVCANLAFAFMGLNPDQFNKTMSPVYLDHVPSGTSTRPIVHYAQLNDYDMEFKKFDFGNQDENIEHYGTATPPSYNFENVQVPVVLMAGDNDYLADVLDVYALSEILPNVQKFEVINITGFTHFDFAIAIDADKVVYNPIIERMNNSLP